MTFNNLGRVAMRHSVRPDAGATDDSIPGSGDTPAPFLTPIQRILWTAAEAAMALRISRRLLWTKTKIGEIPCIRIGRAVRYSPAALQEWIASRKGGAL